MSMSYDSVTGQPIITLAAEPDRPHSFSGKGMCDKAPDTRHEWAHDGWGQQSCEYFRCVHCGTRIAD